MIEERVYSVSELNRAARALLEEGIGPIWVRGEVSNLSTAPSGHAYFTLKDAGSELSAVRFKGRASLLGSPCLADGQSILAFGRLTVYEPRGRYQFVASLVQEAGLGMAQLAFEQLKEKLKKEGLFDPERKRPLVPFPRRIGVITSPTGAAIRDVLSILERRWPAVRVFLFPCSVQGESAPAELVAAIASAARYSQAVEPLDVLIIARGGGSLEDLSAFNDERVARAISASPIPTVSAVGHEIDFTIADFVADVRAPTPSAAAELIVPEANAILSSLVAFSRHLLRDIGSILDRRTGMLDANLRGYIFRIPSRKLETLGQGLDLRLADLCRTLVRTAERRHRALVRLQDRLPLVDPCLPLRRGYSLTYSLGSAIPLRDPRSLSKGGRIETRLSAGRIVSQVEEVSET
jgi:exodeoxyribonuclease VII large subunit